MMWVWPTDQQTVRIDGVENFLNMEKGWIHKFKLCLWAEHDEFTYLQLKGREEQTNQLKGKNRQRRREIYSLSVFLIKAAALEDTLSVSVVVLLSLSFSLSLPLRSLSSPFVGRPWRRFLCHIRPFGISANFAATVTIVYAAKIGLRRRIGDRVHPRRRRWIPRHSRTRRTGSVWSCAETILYRPRTAGRWRRGAASGRRRDRRARTMGRSRRARRRRRLYATFKVLCRFVVHLRHLLWRNNSCRQIQ